MTAKTKKVLRGLGVAGVVLAALYYVLLVHSPSTGRSFPLDLATLRRSAHSVPGALPTEIRVERPFSLYFRDAMIEAGRSWDVAPMAVASYQIVYPDRTIVVDAAMDRETAAKGFPTSPFDDASFARIQRALASASQIVATHEHADHVGGIVTHPRLAALLPALRLTAAQFAHPERMQPLTYPSAMDGYQPLRYRGTKAIAPGVVLVEAAGHSPGSQLVFVQLADGREVLFLGDVSWHARNVDDVRERPWLVTQMIHEDRDAVLGQLAALHALRAADPDVRLVPGHDGHVLDALVHDRFLVPGFR